MFHWSKWRRTDASIHTLRCQKNVSLGFPDAAAKRPPATFKKSNSWPHGLRETVPHFRSSNREGGPTVKLCHGALLLLVSRLAMYLLMVWLLFRKTCFVFRGIKNGWVAMRRRRKCAITERFDFFSLECNISLTLAQIRLFLRTAAICQYELGVTAANNSGPLESRSCRWRRLWNLAKSYVIGADQNRGYVPKPCSGDWKSAVVKSCKCETTKAIVDAQCSFWTRRRVPKSHSICSCYSCCCYQFSKNP